MKVIDAIHAVDNLKPNGYGIPDKIRWLSSVDGYIQREIIDTHEDAPEEDFTGYDDSSEDSADLNRELIAKSPYDELYIHWLTCQIDYNNQEIGRYNNSYALFNASYQTFANYYNRTHKPKTVTRSYLS